MLPIVVSALGIVLSALTIIEKVNSWTVVGIGGFTVRGLRVVDFTILFSSKGHLSFEILSILIISLQYVVQDHLEDFNWCCHGICNPTAHSRGSGRSL
ncbi:uncharacterized protein LOC130951785 isoform X4 [Arachis stenosperma]|uniref:uncharacterized protein LOC130951785 isoform X4 n=1 Tax=Arachis stenosperma TaxID=217475 RepID=UPI0025AD58A3|nr:uncharacterized protein LOC130951785 isoform X4 [Arachis stenosperma]